MDREHPIPQQISSYQFRLVGDMTIKQFFQVAGGALIAILIYSSGLPAYFKWPLIVISFLIGIAFAFFPLEDRPLPKWIYLFIKSIYSPTVFVWKQPKVKQQYFQAEPSQKLPKTPTPPVAKPEEIVAQQQVVDAEIVTKETEKLEKEEQEILSEVTKHFVSPFVDRKTQTPMNQVSAETDTRSQIGVVKTTPVGVGKSEDVKN